MEANTTQSGGNKRVLILVPDLDVPGGVANYFKTIAMDRQTGVDYFPVNAPKASSQLIKLIGLVGKFGKFLLTVCKYDLVHLNPSLNARSFFRDLGFVALARLMGRRTLVFFRGWEDAFEDKIANSAWMSQLFQRTFARADGFIVLGRRFQDKLIRLGADPDKEFFLETTVADSRGVSALDLEAKLASRGAETRILFMSRVLRAKGIYIAIDAFVECARELADQPMSLWIAGDGEELEAARSYAQATGCGDINFVGHVEDDDKIKLLLDCHVMLFPTDHGEGLPNCILEAMLYGMPVITRPKGGIPDVVQHGTHGFVSSSLDSAVFAEFLEALLGDGARFEAMARANHELAAGRFTTESIVARLRQHYAAVLESH